MRGERREERREERRGEEEERKRTVQYNTQLLTFLFFN